MSQNPKDTNGGSRKGLSRRQFVAAGGAVGTAAFAGCAGGLGGSSSVKIGFALPYSGTYSLLGESITNGFKLRVSELDDTLGGNEVEYVQKDTEGDPSTGTTVTREFLNQENVDFIVGPVSSAVAGAMMPIVDNAASAIWVNANAGNDVLVSENCSKYHFRTSFSNWHTSAPMAQWYMDNVGDTAILSYADYTAGQQYQTNFGNAFEELGGTIVDTVAAPLGTSDYSPYLQQIENADAAGIYSFFAGGDAVNYIKQLNQSGADANKTQCGGGFLCSADTLPAQGEAAVGKYTILHYTPWKDTEANNAFVEAYRGAHDRIPNVYACQGYDSATFINNGIDSAGTNADDLIPEMEGMEIDSPRGYLKIDAARHDPVHDLDIREVVQQDGEIRNQVVDTLERQKVPFTCGF